jgi:hypothetical protein
MSFFWRQGWLYTVDWEEWTGERWEHEHGRFLTADAAGQLNYELRQRPPCTVRDIHTSRRPIGVPRSTVV